MTARGFAGTAIVDRAGPFAVVVSDMRMPGMDGAAFLATVRHRWPDMVRVLLTSHADVEAAIRVVNDGQIFRFLLKPCEPVTLRRVLHDAVAQHRLLTAERELLERTLQGSVRSLLEHPPGVERHLRATDGLGPLDQGPPDDPVCLGEVPSRSSAAEPDDALLVDAEQHDR